jgi:hypothetical protein
VTVTNDRKTITRQKVRGIAQSADGASRSAVAEISTDIMLSNPELWSPEVSS